MDSQLQNKLQAFSTAPPEGAWTKIYDALGAEEKYPQRLYQYEEAPPPASWQKVEQALTLTTPATVVPFTTRFQKPLRYAAAACFIAVILVTVTLSIERTEAGALEAESETTVPVSRQSVFPTTAGQLEKEGDSAKDRYNTYTARVKRPGIRTASSTKNDNVTISTAANNSTSAPAIYTAANEYVYFSEGGQRRKVSRKLADFVNCKDNDQDCKQRLRELRQKMATKAMTTDFTGLLEMLRQLQ